MCRLLGSSITRTHSSRLHDLVRNEFLLHFVNPFTAASNRLRDVDLLPTEVQLRARDFHSLTGGFEVRHALPVNRADHFHGIGDIWYFFRRVSTLSRLIEHPAQDITGDVEQSASLVWASLDEDCDVVSATASDALQGVDIVSHDVELVDIWSTTGDKIVRT